MENKKEKNLGAWAFKGFIVFLIMATMYVAMDNVDDGKVNGSMLAKLLG